MDVLVLPETPDWCALSRSQSFPTQKPPCRSCILGSSFITRWVCHARSHNTVKLNGAACRRDSLKTTKHRVPWNARNNASLYDEPIFRFLPTFQWFVEVLENGNVATQHPPPLFGLLSFPFLRETGGERQEDCDWPDFRISDLWMTCWTCAVTTTTRPLLRLLQAYLSVCGTLKSRFFLLFAYPHI